MLFILVNFISTLFDHKLLIKIDRNKRTCKLGNN